MKTTINWNSISKEVIISLFIVFSITGAYAALSSLTATTGESLTASKWNDLVNHATPSGQVSAFSLASCPTGWSAADGTSGNPDLRGTFIRGMNGDANGRDVARVLENFQADSFASHNHETSITQSNGDIFGDASFQNGGGSLPALGNGNVHLTNTSGGTETRPKNIVLLYCIKD